MAGAANDWERRYEDSLEASSAARESASLGPRPELEPSWFSRQGLLPLAMRRDHVMVRGEGNASAIATRTEDTRTTFQGHLRVTFDGDRLVVSAQQHIRGDYMYPVFVGRAVATANQSTVTGIIRPSRWAWPTVALTLLPLIAVVLPDARNRAALALFSALLFIVLADGLVLGRKRNRRRRAHIVMALEKIGGGPARLRNAKPNGSSAANDS